MARLLLAAGVMISFFATGCVRTEMVTHERVDQNLSSGNRGYIMGRPPAGPERTSQKAQKYIAVEVELPGMQPKQAKTGKAAEEYLACTPKSQAVEYTTYTVQKGDTLQKISQKLFGTTKKWQEIYQANSQTLKSPDKIYPGLILKIPQSPLKETEHKWKK
jgi:nucleoid-associated protein YgaU